MDGRKDNGGPREGSGRKKLKVTKVRYATWLQEDVVAIIRKQEKQGEFIEEAVRKYFK